VVYHQNPRREIDLYREVEKLNKSVFCKKRSEEKRRR